MSRALVFFLSSFIRVLSPPSVGSVHSRAKVSMECVSAPYEGDDSLDHPDHLSARALLTQKDVKAVRQMLARFVPLEIALLVLDEAEYWEVLVFNDNLLSPLELVAGHENHYNDQTCCFMSPRIPETLGVDGDGGTRVRKIVFRLLSKDQEWGGNHRLPEPYAKSWTWFEAAIIRGLKGPDIISDPASTWKSINGQTHDESPFQISNPGLKDSKTWHLQRNARASGTKKRHEIAWTREDDIEKTLDDGEELIRSGQGYGRGFIRQLAPGDRIAVIAKAKYPGWINHVYGVQVQVYHSI